MMYWLPATVYCQSLTVACSIFFICQPISPKLPGSGSQKVMEMFLHPHEAPSIAGRGAALLGQADECSYLGICRMDCVLRFA